MMEAGQLLFKSGHLSELSKVLSERFSSLTTWLCQLKSNPNSDFLHVTQKSLDESELEYLPTFHIIIVKLENHASIVEKFQLSLLSYNGKLLAKEEVPTDYIVSSEYLNHLNKGSIRLCRGTSDMNGSSNLVREYLGNTIVLRSEECPYAIMEIEPQSNLKTQCKFCAIAQLKSFGGISPSAHFDLPKSEGKVFESDRTVKNESQLDFLAISEEDGFVNSNGRRRKSKRSNAKSLPASQKPSHQKGKEIKQEEEISYLVSDNFQVDFSDGDQIEPNGSWVEEDNRDELCLVDKCSMTCEKCGREYKSKYPYLKHIRKCLQGEEVPKFSENCKICLKHFYQEKQLERHLEHHRSKHNLDDPIICPECNETLETKLDLNPHFQSVHSRDKGCCIECLEVLESSQLQRHLYSRHFYSVKDRLCTSCGETFASPLKLRVHISSVHDDTGTACVCEQCGKFFPHKIKLNHHIYHHHNTTRPYPCHSCDKVFYNPMAFYKHVKIHSTVKPFFCELCGYRAVRKDNVQQHVRKVHKVEDSAVHVFKDGKFKYEAVERKKQEELEKLCGVVQDPSKKEEGDNAKIS